MGYKPACRLEADRLVEICSDFEENCKLVQALIYKLAVADKLACKMAFVDRPAELCDLDFVEDYKRLLAESCNFVAARSCFAVAAVASICRRGQAMCTDF